MKGLGTWPSRIVALILILAGGGELAAQSPTSSNPDLAALKARRGEFVAGFVEPVTACVRRRDTSHAVFHGCIDWHSSVHGFWALTAAARILDREDLATFVRSSLDAGAIALERADLKARPDFEMPYGRAWFLRLAIEFERSFEDRRLRPMADDLATSLVAFLQAGRIDPLSSSYDSQSWALINLRAYGAATGQPDLVEVVDRIVNESFTDPARACPADLDHRRRSFMAICSNWAWLVSESMDGPAFSTWLHRFLPDPEAIEPVQRPDNAHLYGLNFSRAWGLWHVYRRTGDERFLAAYRRHLEPTFDAPEWWRGDYRVVGHWVSQFGILAAIPLFEPDYS